MIWYLLTSMRKKTDSQTTVLCVVGKEKVCSLWRCIQYSFIGFFYSGITPSATGGQPVQLYYMNKDGKGVFFSTHITSDLDKIADMLIMIDSGQIVFQEEKDQLLDSYRIIKGSAEKLNSDTRKMFLCTEESAFNFTGITKQASVVMECMQDVLIERPTIEDIMLANVERRKKNVI